MEPPFPVNVQEFDGDDRISFSKLDNKFIAVRDDGSEFEFDAGAKKWVPTDDGPVEDGEPGHYGGGQHDGLHDKKRKLEHEHGNQSDKVKAPRPAKKQKAPPPPKENTAVYVTGLPDDATVSEIYELFSRKAGLIAEEIDSGAPRIKLYYDENGTFKGDALVVFFKPLSVNQAITLLDDADFRISHNGASGGRIRVQAADSSYKKVQYDDDEKAGGGAVGNGHQSEKRPPRSDKDRQKIIKKTRKLDAKLADWDDDDPYPAQTQKESKWDKVVNLRHMFTLKELEEDPAALLEIKEDIRDECSKLGTVTSVILYDLEPEGIVRVKFREAKSAQECINIMGGRHFDGRTVEASLASPADKFRKTSKQEHDGDSD